MSIHVTPSGGPTRPDFVAEISGIDLAQPLKPADRDAIESAINRYAVVVFRGQKLSDDDLLAFSRRFGELDPPPNQERGRIAPPRPLQPAGFASMASARWSTNTRPPSEEA